MELGQRGLGQGRLQVCPNGFLEFIFLLRKFVFYLYNLKIHQDKKKNQKRNFAFLEVNGGLISGKVKANLDKTETLPDTKI